MPTFFFDSSMPTSRANHYEEAGRSPCAGGRHGAVTSSVRRRRRRRSSSRRRGSTVRRRPTVPSCKPSPPASLPQSRSLPRLPHQRRGGSPNPMGIGVRLSPTITQNTRPIQWKILGLGGKLLVDTQPSPCLAASKSCPQAWTTCLLDGGSLASH